MQGRSSEIAASSSADQSLRIHRKDPLEIVSKIDFSEYIDTMMNVSNEKRNNLSEIFKLQTDTRDMWK